MVCLLQYSPKFYIYNNVLITLGTSVNFDRSLFKIQLFEKAENKLFLNASNFSSTASGNASLQKNKDELLKFKHIKRFFILL